MMSSENLEVVEKGEISAKKCSEVLEEIIIGINEASKKAIEIKNGAFVQNSEVKEIKNSMETLEHVSAKNTEVSDRISQTIGALASQAEKLNNHIMDLDQIIKGGQA